MLNISSGRRRCAAVLTLAALSGVVAAGCGSSDKSDDNSSGNAAASTGNKSKGKVKVALIVHYQGPATQVNANAAKQAGKELGADVTTAGPTTFDAPAQIQMFNDAISAGAKGVAVVPYPPDVWQKTVDDTIGRGVEVASFNVPAPNSKIPLYVGVNEHQFGEAEAKAALAKLDPKGSGDVVVGICAPDAQVLKDRVAGVKRLFAAQAPGYKIQGAFEVKPDPAGNFASWQALRQKYGSAKAMIGVCAQDGPSLAKVTQKEGGHKFVSVTSDLGADVFEALKSGDLDAAINQSPWIQGYAPTRALIESLKSGKPIPSGWFDAGIETVTKDNVDAVQTREASTESLAKYYKPIMDKKFANLKANLKPLDQVLN